MKKQYFAPNAEFGQSNDDHDILTASALDQNIGDLLDWDDMEDM